MADTLKIALAQLNPTMGDIAGNLALLRKARAEAAALGAELVIATEMVITGYPTEDLVLKPMFLDAAETAVRALAEDTADGGPGMIVGYDAVKFDKTGQNENASLVMVQVNDMGKGLERITIWPKAASSWASGRAGCRRTSSCSS